MIKRQIIKGDVYTEQCRFVNKSLYLAGDRIVTVDEYQKLDCPEEIVNAKGKYVIPGLIDIHFHGCMGHDFCDGTPEVFEAIAKYESGNGITAVTPAVVAMPEEEMLRVARAAAGYQPKQGARFAGLYMEGPFISAEKKGAQNAAYIRKPDMKLYERLQEAADGAFRTVVVAPELEGAMDFIGELTQKVNVALAYSTANFEIAQEAMELGALQLAHLFNTMPVMSHRSPGLIGAAVDNDSCRAELICDGVHIHPAVVRTTFRMFGDDRIILISDSVSATGMQDGEYSLGGQRVIVKDNHAVLEDGTIAGSVTNLMDCMRIAVKEMKIPLESAIKSATANPAKAVGIFEQYGSLEPGKAADVVLLDKELGLCQVYQGGEPVLV